MRKDKAYLKHILDAIADIKKFTGDISKEKFYEDKEKQYSVKHRGLTSGFKLAKNRVWKP